MSSSGKELTELNGRGERRQLPQRWSKKKLLIKLATEHVEDGGGETDHETDHGDDGGGDGGDDDDGRAAVGVGDVVMVDRTAGKLEGGQGIVLNVKDDGLLTVRYTVSGVDRSVNPAGVKVLESKQQQQPPPPSPPPQQQQQQQQQQVIVSLSLHTHSHTHTHTLSLSVSQRRAAADTRRYI